MAEAAGDDSWKRALAEGEALLEARGRHLEQAPLRRLVGWLLVGSALVLFAAAWMFRYDITMTNGAGFLKLDRWTGQVYVCSPSRCVKGSEYRGT